jgi:hypothetical protein
MTLETVIINGKKYTYYSPSNYQYMKLHLRQMKMIREKIRACETGCYKDKVTRNGVKYYNDYPELLSFLETLLKEKTE